MFQPAYFKQQDTQLMLAFIEEYSMASIVTLSSNGLVGNHIPMIVVEHENNYFLQGHVTRANSIHKDFDKNTGALAMFHGSNAYISPNWYPSKKKDPKVVPTWNYVAVHVRGEMKFFDNKDWLKQHLIKLSNINEKKVGETWQLSDAPEGYIATMLKAIIGVEIEIKEIKGNTKMSQNHSQENRDGVIRGLNALNRQDVASWIENPNKLGKL